MQHCFSFVDLLRTQITARGKFCRPTCVPGLLPSNSYPEESFEDLLTYSGYCPLTLSLTLRKATASRGAQPCLPITCSIRGISNPVKFCQGNTFPPAIESLTCTSLHDMGSMSFGSTKGSDGKIILYPSNVSL